MRWHLSRGGGSINSFLADGKRRRRLRQTRFFPPRSDCRLPPNQKKRSPPPPVLPRKRNKIKWQEMLNMRPGRKRGKGNPPLRPSLFLERAVSAVLEAVTSKTASLSSLSLSSPSPLGHVAKLPLLLPSPPFHDIACFPFLPFPPPPPQSPSAVTGHFTNLVQNSDVRRSSRKWEEFTASTQSMKAY